jgi:glutamine synthetase
VTNPLVNSYKRLASGFEAPATISWAHENRSAFIRVPVTPRAQPELARIELRSSDPACNPYLALAAMLQAGLAGISEQKTPPEPVEEQVYPFETSERLPLGATWLPLTLGEALTAFSSSRLMRETFGEYIFGRFAEMKRREWRTYQTQVTDWEQQTCWKTA